MHDPVIKNIIEILQDKSNNQLVLCPTRLGLNNRVQQVSGMIELIKLLPTYRDLLRPLEQHQEWLKLKQTAWPI